MPARYETRENYYTDLRMAMAISSSRFLPMWTIPVPALDGSDTILFFMFPEEWDVKYIVSVE
jgi:hypothetical protein